MRILSPTSITAGSNNEHINFVQYYKYLKSFGYWKQAKVNGFDDYYDLLKEAWEESMQLKQSRIKGIGLFNQLTDRFR